MSEWISVTERLPNRALQETMPKYPFSNWMLIFSNGNMELARYNDEEKEWYDDFGEVITGVTHWIPLPKPPKSSMEASD